MKDALKTSKELKCMWAKQRGKVSNSVNQTYILHIYDYITYVWNNTDSDHYSGK